MKASIGQLSDDEKSKIARLIDRTFALGQENECLLRALETSKSDHLSEISSLQNVHSMKLKSLESHCKVFEETSNYFKMKYISSLQLLQKYQGKISFLVKNLRDVQQVSEEKVTSLGNLTLKLEELRISCSKYEEKMNDLSSQIVNLTQTNNILTEEIRKKSLTCEAFEKKYEISDQLCYSLRQQLDHLQLQVETLTASNSSLKNQQSKFINNYSNNINSLKNKSNETPNTQKLNNQKIISNSDLVTPMAHRNQVFTTEGICKSDKTVAWDENLSKTSHTFLHAHNNNSDMNATSRTNIMNKSNRKSSVTWSSPPEQSISSVSNKSHTRTSFKSHRNIARQEIMDISALDLVQRTDHVSEKEVQDTNTEHTSKNHQDCPTTRSKWRQSSDTPNDQIRTGKSLGANVTVKDTDKNYSLSSTVEIPPTYNRNTKSTTRHDNDITPRNLMATDLHAYHSSNDYNITNSKNADRLSYQSNKCMDNNASDSITSNNNDLAYLQCYDYKLFELVRDIEVSLSEY